MNKRFTKAVSAAKPIVIHLLKIAIGLAFVYALSAVTGHYLAVLIIS